MCCPRARERGRGGGGGGERERESLRDKTRLAVVQGSVLLFWYTVPRYHTSFAQHFNCILSHLVLVAETVLAAIDRAPLGWRNNYIPSQSVLVTEAVLAAIDRAPLGWRKTETGWNARKVIALTIQEVASCFETYNEPALLKDTELTCLKQRLGV